MFQIIHIFNKNFKIMNVSLIIFYDFKKYLIKTILKINKKILIY